MTVLHLLDASLRAIIGASFAGLLLAVARQKLAAFEHLIWTAVMLSMLIFAIPHICSSTSRGGKRARMILSSCCVESMMNGGERAHNESPGEEDYTCRSDVV